LGSLAGSSLAHVGQSEPLLEQSLRLQEAGIRPELIDRVIGGVRDELSPDELADTQIVAVAVQRHVASMLPVAGAVARAGNRPHPHTGTPRPLVIALIGPTGVGKTTTIAKLAATYALKHGAKVGLITCDTYRIAAVDQLRTYAGIMDMPMKVALTPREAMEAADSLSDCGVILVDSAGRSPQDSVRLEEMGAFLEALAPEQTHLVLNVGSAEDALTHAATRFSTLQPTHLLLTKLDEAVRYGVLINLVQAVGLKISYVTTGQEVPAQIELAQPERLARLVLEAKLWRTA
jgi:flagellar biosynthesis protein FlhF